jgi:NADPH-dependent 2,4-dienoyl-CoA reductase/sulfur reductase-like enzyme
MTSGRDVLIVGGGPAGIAAAVAVSDCGGSAIIVSDQRDPGGQIWRRDLSGKQAPPAAAEWLRRLERGRVRWLSQATVVDGGVDVREPWVTVEREGKRERHSAAALILATGARELFLPFPGWTLPGVTGVGGLQAMAKTGLDVAGKRVVIAGTGPLMIAVAASLIGRGAKIVTIAEQAPTLRMLGFMARLATAPRVARDALSYGMTLRPGQIRFGTWVEMAAGDDRVRSAVLFDGRRRESVDCELLAVGCGLVPNVELAQLLGCTVSDGVVVDDSQESSVRGVYAAGECVGVAGVDAALAEGTIAGAAACGAPVSADARRDRSNARGWGRRLAETFALRKEVLQLARADTMVCRCEDVRLADIDADWSARQAKLYSRVGMGACQGRVCGAALRAMRGWSPDRVRAPLYPAYLSTLATSTSDQPSAV